MQNKLERLPKLICTLFCMRPSLALFAFISFGLSCSYAHTIKSSPSAISDVTDDDVMRYLLCGGLFGRTFLAHNPLKYFDLMFEKCPARNTNMSTNLV